MFGSRLMSRSKRSYVNNLQQVSAAALVAQMEFCSNLRRCLPKLLIMVDLMPVCSLT